MSADDALFAEQASTSLYVRADGARDSERYALSLARADPEYCELPDPVENRGADDEGDEGPEIVVQLRKRQGKTELFIDGYKSPGVRLPNGPSNVWYHTLTWHRGLHEDVETGTRVFSPIAVVAAVEDGQRALQGVTVGVLRTFYNYDHSVLSSALLSEASLQPHSVRDVRCRIRRVPYPLTYPAPPCVTIFDKLKTDRTNALAAANTAIGTVTDVRNNMRQVITYIGGASGNNTSSVTLFRSLRNSRAAQGAVVGIIPTGILAVLLSMGTYTAWAGIVRLMMPLSAGLALGGTQLLRRNAWSQMQAAARISLDAANVVLQLPPGLPETQTKFTIRELAATLRALAVMRTPQQEIDINEESVSLESSQYRKEMVVWEWLKGADVTAMDTSLLAISKRFAAVVHLRLAVDDASGCSPAEQYHEIHCNRPDCHVLGAAAAGTLNDIEELLDAVNALKKNLRAGIEGADVTWYDRTSAVFRSAWQAFKTVVPLQRARFQQATPAQREALGMDQTYERILDAAEVMLAAEPTTSQAVVAQVAAPNPTPLANPSQRAAARWKRLLQLRRLANPKGFFMRFQRDIREWFAKRKSPASPVRKAELQTILDALDSKLLSAFFDPNTEGGNLMSDLYAALEEKRLPERPPGCDWIRQLPQRAVATNSTQLFSARASTINGHTDVTNERVVSRVYSEYHDADQWFADTMRGAGIALRRLAREWEGTSSMRIKLACLCKALSADRVKRQDALVPLPACETLVLTTPVDVRVAGVLAAPTEHSQRQIRLVVKRAQQQADASLLEAMGLQHTDEALLASQLFGDLWVDELVTLHGLGDKTAPVQMLEQASMRAVARLRAAGTLLMELVTVHNPSTNIGSFDDVPCPRTDISLEATQPGRDAGRLVGRILFHHDYVAIRALLAPMLRGAARAAIDAARVFEQRVPKYLPHEPVASLFGNSLDGVAAYARVRAMEPSSSRVVAAAAAAYPSVHLLPRDPAASQALLQAARNRPVPELRVPLQDFRDLVLAMRFRLASLRMDVVVDDEATSAQQSVDQLAEQLASVTLSQPVAFYVPFGFGDARPPPTLPPCAAPMFGSVPVFGKPIAAAFRSMQAPQLGAASAKKAFRIRLEPTLDCLQPVADARPEPGRPRLAEEGESVHPNVIQVRRDAKDGVVTVRYVASRIQRKPVPSDDANHSAEGSATDAAENHVRDDVAERMASDVCSIAWNAERVMQAVIAALASADDAEGAYDTILVDFVHPEDGGEQSLWYSRPQNPTTIEQKRRYYGRRAVVTIEGLRYTYTSHHKTIVALLKALKKYDKGIAVPEADYEAASSALAGLAGRPQANVADETWFGKADQKQQQIRTIAANLDAMAAYYQREYDQKMASWDENAEMGGATLLGEGRTRAAREAYSRKLQEEMSAKRRVLEDELSVAEERVRSIRRLEEQLKRERRLQVGRERATVVVAGVDTEDARKARVRNALIGALGIGMGMLAPLLGTGVTVACESVSLDEWPAPVVVGNLLSAFGKCDAIRLSEACLVVSSALR